MGKAKAAAPARTKVELKVMAKFSAKNGREPTDAELAQKVAAAQAKKAAKQPAEAEAEVEATPEAKKAKKAKKAAAAPAAAPAAAAVPAVDAAFFAAHLVKCSRSGAAVEMPRPVLEFPAAAALFGQEFIGKLTAKGFITPTPIQSIAWPVAAQGDDLVAIAKTGSGKTLAYLLPALVVPANGKKVRVLVLAPTRELAQQISRDALLFDCCAAGGPKPALTIFGGADRSAQKSALKKGAFLVVATPGRLQDFINTKDVDLSTVGMVILDEADRMLDMGFEPQLASIKTALGATKRSTLFFSATWPPAVRKLATSYATGVPLVVSVGQETDEKGELEAGATANKSVAQAFEKLDDSEKDAALVKIIDAMGEKDRMICFTNTKRRVDYLHKALWQEGYGSSAIHGDRSQREREDALKKFESGEWPLMFATDVAARGLDLPDVSVVVNFDMPRDVETYCHRIGRTGRAGKTGKAVTFWNAKYDIECSPALAKIARDAGQPVPDWLDEVAKKSKTSKLWKVE
ncbi:P-loop containing nucleoside triphosphate hydrolase protein [Pelagophyceae sp. CCMP2097]|nr:P-loop containing nucleoside triphosphate hydrolase protein [Pelagophyceae sp. CCMP2097]